MSSTPDGRRAHQRRISLSVTLVTESGRLPGHLRQLSSSGCRASFVAELLPDLGAETIELEFDGLLLIEPLRVEALVRACTRVDGRAILHFEFAEPEKVQQDVPYVLLVEFTRRAAPRVTLESRPAVQVKGETIDGEANLVEISSGGAGLHVPFVYARALAKGDEFKLAFELPEHAARFRLNAVVRTLHPQDGGVGCSVQFLEEGSADFAEQVERLGGLVDLRLESEQLPGDLREAG